MSIYTTMESPLGDLILVGEAANGGVTLREVSFAEAAAVDPRWRRDPGAFGGVERQVREYFARHRTAFALEHVPHGTPVPRRGWAAGGGSPYRAAGRHGAGGARGR